MLQAPNSTQDELTGLFCRSMNISSVAPLPEEFTSTSLEPSYMDQYGLQQRVELQQPSRPVVHTSMHYNQTHMLPTQKLVKTPVALTDDEILVLLQQSNIDPK